MRHKLFSSKLAVCAFFYLIALSLLALFAPLLASGKPLFVAYEGKFYFPLFRALFFKGYFTKEIDLFFNALLVSFPLFVLALLLLKKKTLSLLFFSLASLLTLILYLAASSASIKNPDLEAENEKISSLVRYRRGLEQEKRVHLAILRYENETKKKAPLLFTQERARKLEEKERLETEIEKNRNAFELAKSQFALQLAEYRFLLYELADAKMSLKSALEGELETKSIEKKKLLTSYQKVISDQKEREKKLIALIEKERWLKDESEKLFVIFPLFRPFHWQEDAGGGEKFNHYLPFSELTRPCHRDLASSLLFGIRLSLVVGVLTTLLSLMIGLPLGLLSGYFGGRTDLYLFRFIEIWEAMPAFFMLLLITALVHFKSIFLIILVLAIFSWTSLARYLRGETLKQRALLYVTAAKSLGFSHWKILFSEVLPNAMGPVLALVPFSVMAAITQEAGLAFLGLGEENSTSFGALMSEARAYFPAESYLLWPPAVILTTLLVSFAIIGDALRDALDPKRERATD